MLSVPEIPGRAPGHCPAQQVQQWNRVGDLSASRAGVLCRCRSSSEAEAEPRHLARHTPPLGSVLSASALRLFAGDLPATSGADERLRLDANEGASTQDDIRDWRSQPCLATRLVAKLQQAAPKMFESQYLDFYVT